MNSRVDPRIDSATAPSRQEHTKPRTESSRDGLTQMPQAIASDLFRGRGKQNDREGYALDPHNEVGRAGLDRRIPQDARGRCFFVDIDRKRGKVCTVKGASGRDGSRVACPSGHREAHLGTVCRHRGPHEGSHEVAVRGARPYRNTGSPAVPTSAGGCRAVRLTSACAMPRQRSSYRSGFVVAWAASRGSEA